MFPIKSVVSYRHPPIVTWGLIGINAAIFLLEMSLDRGSLQAFFYQYGLVPARYGNPEWAAAVGLSSGNVLPFFTNIFLHGGWLHILANMWMLYIFGPAIEDRMGKGRFLLFYLICGVGASAAHFLVYMQSMVPALGASGAIAGILGAFMRLFPMARVIVFLPVFFMPYFFEVPAFLFALIWFGLQLLQGLGALVVPTSGAGVAWWAHIGGFALGAVLVRVMYPGRGGRPRRGPWGYRPPRR